MIHIFANGGPSHLDTFDRKPLLEEYAGREIPSHLPTERRTGAALPSPFRFARHGESGLERSELFPSVARHADRLLVVRSMRADVPNHEPSLMLMNCGDARLVRPAAGAWVTYGLGTENQNLPGFVAMCPGGYPIKGTENWRSGFLPGAFQGTYVDTKKRSVDELVHYVRHPFLAADAQRRQFDLTTELDREHLARRLVGLGLLESTLVLWGGEFGGTPTVELPNDAGVKSPTGRDHNHHVFTVWMAGGGVRGGTVYGATDEFGFKAVEKPVRVHDLQATMLHLLGLDHTKLAYRHSGGDFRLTDVHGSVISDWLA